MYLYAVCVLVDVNHPNIAATTITAGDVDNALGIRYFFIVRIDVKNKIVNFIMLIFCLLYCSPHVRLKMY